MIRTQNTRTPRFVAASTLIAVAAGFTAIAFSTQAQPEDRRVLSPDQALRPSAPDRGKSRGLSAKKAHELAEQWGSSGLYFVEVPREVTVLSGALIRLDADIADPEGLAFDGESFDQGVWLNGSADNYALIAFDDHVIPIQPNQALALIVRDLDGVLTGTPGGGCSVTCGLTGWSACCNRGTGQNNDTCLCYPDADIPECEAGGRGSSSCSLPAINSGGGGGGGGGGGDEPLVP